MLEPDVALWIKGVVVAFAVTYDADLYCVVARSLLYTSCSSALVVPVEVIVPTELTSGYFRVGHAYTSAVVILKTVVVKGVFVAVVHAVDSVLLVVEVPHQLF